ncbi:MAG TPA: hypothetical protein VND70_07455 [Acidimicrobiales bacterium]|nr:hypothetical protein [Acidimicrobiales bacterium]
MRVERHPGDGHPADGRDARWYLEDERDFLQRSLLDAEREHAAGDLSEADRTVLVTRDRTRLTEVEAELAALGPAPGRTAHNEPVSPPGAPPMPGWRRLAIAAACFLIATGAVILVTHARQARQPGQAPSGSITLSQAALIANQLAQAQKLSDQHQTLAALKLYDMVLSEDPANPAAMAGAGWLKWNTGYTAHVASLTADGRREVERAVQASPSYYAAHLFLGLILENQDDNHTGAVTQFNDFVIDDPPAYVMLIAAPLVEGAYKAAGVPLPVAFTAAPVTTTSTP